MSKSAHVTERAFTRKFPNEGRQVKKALRELIREGYVKQHSTCGEMTYDLTNEGLAFCREMAQKSY